MATQDQYDKWFQEGRNKAIKENIIMLSLVILVAGIAWYLIR